MDPVWTTSHTRGRMPVGSSRSTPGGTGTRWVAERPKGTVLKTVVAAMSPWVQIPPPPRRS